MQSVTTLMTLVFVIPLFVLRVNFGENLLFSVDLTL